MLMHGTANHTAPPRRIMSAAFSVVMMTGEAVLPETMRGMIEAATTGIVNPEHGMNLQVSARVIYFYGGKHIPIHAALACSKSARTDLSPAQRRAVATLVEAIRSAGKKRK